MKQGRAWFLQSNPKHYDIDAALGALDRIWWRVPQYTGEIHVGDVAVLWRSGKDAGIVGVGRVVSEPQLRQVDLAEKPFIRTAEEDAGDATRALVRIRPVPTVPKDKVRTITAFRQHQVVIAPRGTVFPISADGWEALKSLLPTPPDTLEDQASALPPAFAWSQRAKGVLPMPGGYTGYLGSLRRVCAVVAEERPTPVELATRLETVLGVRATGARLRESFLRKVGIIAAAGGVCRLGAWTEKWLASGDDRLLIGLLHSRCQFVGELLHAARTPSSTAQLLSVANERYGMGWDTQTQIVNRRGWLQSAGMLVGIGDGKVHVTPAGLSLLAELTLHDPATELVLTTTIEPTAEAATIESPLPPEQEILDGLVDEIRNSATDSGHADRFERAVRDAFVFLGFQAEWLGGSGKTDVLIDARLGVADSYRVVVDCKTSAAGSVGDAQIDWVTLTEHKTKHDAHHIALVAPNPTGTRLFERARQHAVAVISVDELIGLCRQHAKAPLGLDDYRSVFAHGGHLDTQAVDERAEEVKRLTALAAAICETIRDQSSVFGRLSARDLLLILTGRPVAEGTTEEELQALLDTLASPLLGVLHGSTSDGGYRVTCSARVARDRVDAVARQLYASGAGDHTPASA